jgi:ribose/xylose/arabinose/galactoside ABC-type transport system permease subunit
MADLPADLPSGAATRRLGLSPVLRSMLFLLGAFVVLCAVFAVMAPNFASTTNLTNILRHMAMIGIISVAMTMVIISGEIDLSVGSTAALSGVVVAYATVTAGLPSALAILLTVLMGAALGALIGALRVFLLIPTFITSLAVLTSARSGAYLISGGFPISPLPPIFDRLGNGSLGLVPISVLVMFAIFALGWFVLNRTAWGRMIYAVGGNEEASRLSGIDVGWVKIGVLMLSGALAALAGVFLAGRLNSGTPTVATGWELDVIAAVIIGGTSLFGGAGSVAGTLLGALFMATLKNGMVLMGVSPFAQGVVSGIVILLAVIAGAIQSRRN